MKPVVKKLSAMLLSLAMVVSLSPIPGGLLFADETDAATPTTVGDTESGNKKESEKPAAEKPKETEKQAESAPKETKKPEAEAPKETEKQEPEAPKEKENTETEAPKETEKPAEEVPAETTPETEVPAETEKPEAEQPKETETPAETEKPAEETPAGSEQPAEEAPEIPEETTPGESEANDPQKAPIVPANITGVTFDNGVLTWNKVTGATQYEIKIDSYRFYTTSNSYDVGKEIDRLITLGDLYKDGSYYISLYAYDKSGNYKAEWGDYISYDSNAERAYGIITNCKIKNGVLTWDKFSGADHYYVLVNGCWSDELHTNSFKLNAFIDEMIEKGYMDVSSTNIYKVEIQAETQEWNTAAISATLDHEYKTSVTPIKTGDITHPNITDGVLTWDAFDGAAKYYVELSSAWGKLTDKTSVNIGEAIDELIANGALSKADDNEYWVGITAYSSKDIEVASWYGYLTYETSSSAPVTGAIQDATVSDKGILSWTAYPGASQYWVLIDWEWVKVTTTSMNLHQQIDKFIKEDYGFKQADGKYDIIIYADNSYGATIASCSLTCTYNSEAEYITPGSIGGVNFDTNGTMKWDKYPGATKYEVYVEDCKSTVTSTSFALNSRINYLVSSGYIEKYSPYSIYIYAYNKDGLCIAEWYGDYHYNTSSKPVTVGSIANLKSSNGILTWSKYKGAVKYAIKIDYNSHASAYTTGTSCYINNVITSLIAKEELSKDRFYSIKVEALNKNGGVIGYAYTSHILLESNTLNVSGKTVKAKRRKTKSFSASKAFTFKDRGQGKITYSKASGNKKIKVSSAGKITVKKGLKKKTYKVTIKVKAAGNSITTATVKTVTVKVKVR